LKSNFKSPKGAINSIHDDRREQYQGSNGKFDHQK